MGPGLCGSLIGGAASTGAAASVRTAGVCCSCEAEMISRPSQKGSSTSSVGALACFEFLLHALLVPEAHPNAEILHSQSFHGYLGIIWLA